MLTFIQRSLPIALLLTAVAAPLTGQQRGVAPDDYYRMVSVGDVAVSPDGAMVAFTRTTVVEEDNRRKREVWLQRLQDGRPAGEPFRFSDPSRDSSSPRWSPDGSLLSFQSQRGPELESVWFARVTAPGGEAFQIEGVRGTPVWSPDGEWIAYTWAEPREEGERVGWISPDAVTSTLDAERFDGRVITYWNYKSDGRLEFVPHPATTPSRQLYIVPAEGGEPRRLTDFDFDVSAPVWAADGRVLFVSGDEEQGSMEVRQTRDLFAIPFDGGEPRKITTNPGSESSPAVSPDGRRLAFLSTAASGAKRELLVVEIDATGAFNGSPRTLTADWPYDAGAPEWSADGRRLRFSTNHHGNSHLFEVDAGGGEVRQVTSGDRQLDSFSFSADERVMAYTGTDATTPVELFAAAADGSREQRLTGFNDEWLAEVTIMPAERLTWTVSDGTEIEGWVIKPVGFQPGESYPMVLKIHGGPHSMYGNTFFQTFHVLSNAGMFVLYSNPRGSSGYGNEFQYATLGEWHLIDQEDFLTGVDAALAAYPEIDADRLGVSGGSYGGVSTNWLTATTDRFAAAVTSRSITNWFSWWGTSDVPNLTEFEFGGFPWEQRDRYTRLSPITYVENVTAPTLIIHSENDWRTPMADAEQWFMALQKLGVPSEFIRYPRSSHGLSRTGEPWLLVDRLERIRSWFSHWLVENPEQLPPRSGVVTQQ